MAVFPIIKWLGQMIHVCVCVCARAATAVKHVYLLAKIFQGFSGRTWEGNPEHRFSTRSVFQFPVVVKWEGDL